VFVLGCESFVGQFLVKGFWLCASLLFDGLCVVCVRFKEGVRKLTSRIRYDVFFQVLGREGLV
jgi:hypothetical protein